MPGQYPYTGFDKSTDWLSSLARTPQLFCRRAGRRKNPMDQLADAQEGGAMAKVLNWFHVTMLGTGMIVGAGIFVSTGQAAAEEAGPAVVISFIIAGISALLSALCYSEFAAEYPVAGGAFNYLLLSMGELSAWLVVTTLIMQYVLANAAVARAFTAYFAALIGKPTDFFIIKYASYDVDFMAGGLIILLAIILCFTTAGGSWFNLVITIAQLLVIAIILVIGWTKSSITRMQPFAPMGFAGIFNGAAFVFFSFIGFDCVSTLAEEVKNPGVDMPVGIVGCITFVTTIYTLLAWVLVMMVPYNLIDTKASFATAFTQVGLPWGQYLVAVGACLGIITGVLVGMMGVSRIVCAMSRTHLWLPCFGKVHSKFNTPMWATIMTSVMTLPLAILTDLPALIDMVSAGTLMCFAVVAIALIWKRYTDVGTQRRNSIKALTILGLIVASCVAAACVYGLMDHESLGFKIGLAVTLGACLPLCLLLHFTCPQYNLPKYKMPGIPYLPTISIALNCILMASLTAQAYIQLAVFFAVMLGIYLIYGIHAATYYEDTKLGRAADVESIKSVASRQSSLDRSPGSIAVFTRASAGIKYLPPPTED